MRAATIALGILIALSFAQAAPVPGTVRHLPPGADILLGVDWEAFQQAPLIMALKAKGEIKVESEDLEKLKGVLGFDPLKDLDRLTVGLALADDEDMPVKDWIVVLEGKFDGFQLDALVGMLGEKAEGMKVGTVQIYGKPVRMLDLPADKDRQAAMQVGLVRLNDETLVTGSREYLQSFLGAWSGKSKGLSAATGLGEIASRVPPESTFWLAANPERVTKRIKLKHKSPHLKNIPEIKDLLVTGLVSKDVLLAATARTVDKETAKNLQDACRGLLALAKLMPHDEQELRELVEGIKIETGDREVTVRATLPGKLIESHH